MKWECNRTLLHEAVVFDHDRLIKHLIERNVDLNAKDGRGFSAYHYAARRGSTLSLQMLLEADPHHVNDVGSRKYTPLMEAVRNDRVKSVELLMRFQPNLSLVSDEGLTALGWARRLNHVECIKLLEEGLENK